LDSRACISFDGADDRLVSPSFDFRGSAASYTVAMWIKPTDVSGLERLVFQDDIMSLYCSDDDIVWLPNFGTAFTASTVLTAGQWHHIIATFNASDNAVAVYVDGISEVTGTDTTTDTTGEGAAVIYFGYEDDTTDDYTGSMRDIRMYDYALSADQAASLFRGSYNVTPEYGWKLDEGTGNASGWGTDASPPDLAVSGASWVTSNFTVNGAARIHTNGGLT